MAIKTISQFPSGIPTNNDYILFEQNGEGKSAKFSDFSLSYEEIMASKDLSGKVASASAVKDLKIKSMLFESAEADSNGVVVTNLPRGRIPVFFFPYDRNGWILSFLRYDSLSTSYWCLGVKGFTGTVKGLIYYFEGV